MTIFFNTPAIIKVLTSLFLILLVNRLSGKLLPAMLAGTVLLAFWCGHSLLAAAGIAWERFASPGNLFFACAIYMTIWLSSQMAETGVMRELASLVVQRLPGRPAFAILPALIGLLPMPGGALFSAPLVDDSDPEKKLSPLLKTRINYWFRHIWEYWWPLYPGVLTAIEITKLEVWQYMLLQLPMSLIACLVGYFFILRKVPAGTGRQNSGKALKQFLILIMPVLVIIACYFLFTFGIKQVSAVSQSLPIVIGIAAAMLVLQFQRPLKAAAWRKIICSRKSLLLVLLVIVIRIYGAFIDAPLPDGTLLAAHMHRELAAVGIPVILTIALIPFICGMVSGIAVGFVGASFPIVLGLIGQGAPPPVFFATIVFAFGCGYMGMILSPVHICLIVTNEYFKTKVGQSIASLVLPSLCVLAGNILLSLIIYLLPLGISV